MVKMIVTHYWGHGYIYGDTVLSSTEHATHTPEDLTLTFLSLRASLGWLNRNVIASPN